MLIDFCLPIKNESLILKNNLNKLLSYCRQSNFDFSWRIIGVINGSTDDSVLIFQNFKEDYPAEIDFYEIKEPGRGGALKKYWSQSEADIFVYMDADLAVSLDNIPRLIDPLIRNEGDLSIGSRLIKTASVERRLSREIISRVYNSLSRFLLSHRIFDLQCGFKAVRREAFQKLAPFLEENMWFFDTELAVLADRLGYRLIEVPVDWRENRFSRRSSTVKILRDSLLFLKNLRDFRKRLKSIKKYHDNV